MSGVVSGLAKRSTMVGHGVPITFVSVQPEHSRIVLTVYDKAAKERLEASFRERPEYRISAGMMGEQRANLREGPLRRYEVKVGVTGRVTAA